MPHSLTVRGSNSRISTKGQHGTFLSRQNFYFTTFCDTYLLSHNPFLTGISIDDQNEIFAIYAEFLLTKHNLKFIDIKQSTVKLYLKAAARAFITKKLHDPRLSCSGAPSALQ